jgi:DNA-binding MarR family transcriptional regulator
MPAEIDENERTNAVGLFNTARSYWRSAEYLSTAHLEGVTHPRAPVTFLFCHAIELYLKAYLRGAGRDVSQLKQLGHHVANLAQSAIKSGLAIGQEHSEILDHIDDADVAIEARYIVTGFKGSLPTNEALSDVATVLDQTVCNALAEMGFAARAQEFRSLPPQRENNLNDDLSDDTIRVLIYMFKAANYLSRDIGAIAIALRLERGIVQYHLERLHEANLAESAGGNYLHGHVYWDLTPEGRRYVVERKLI